MAKNTSIYESEYRELIEHLVAFRKHKGITQEQISKATGMPRYDISKVETFVRRLDVLELAKWLKALDIKENLLDHVNDLLKQK